MGIKDSVKKKKRDHKRMFWEIQKPCESYEIRDAPEKIVKFKGKLIIEPIWLFKKNSFSFQYDWF